MGRISVALIQGAALLLGLTAALLIPGAAWANGAPVIQVGPGMQPVGESGVRLEREQIEIYVRRGGSRPDQFWRPVVAEVRVDFHLMPGADESLQVGFPLKGYWNEGWDHVIQVAEFAVELNGQPVPHREEPVTWEGKTWPWAVWQLDLKRDQPVLLTMRYPMPVEALGKGAGGDLFIKYILRTGRYWSGSIGRAQATIRLEQPILEGDIHRDSTPGWRLENGAAHWEWHDLEPDFNLELRVANLFWLNQPAEVLELADRPNLSSAELSRLYAGVYSLLLGEGMFGIWIPMRDGQLSGELVQPVLPRVLELLAAAAAAEPAGETLWRTRWQRILYEASWRMVDYEHPVLYNPEQYRAFLATRPERNPGFISNPHFWSELVKQTYLQTEDPELREGALAILIGRMPERFSSVEGAGAWVESYLKPSRDWGDPPQATPELRQELLAAALARVKEEPLPVVAEPVGPGSGEAAPTEPGAPEPAPDGSAGRPWLLVLGAGAAALLAAVLTWRRRGAGRSRST